MSKKVIDDEPMIVMDDLDDILMEDLDDLLEKGEDVTAVLPSVTITEAVAEEAVCDEPEPEEETEEPEEEVTEEPEEASCEETPLIAEPEEENIEISEENAEESLEEEENDNIITPDFGERAPVSVEVTRDEDGEVRVEAKTGFAPTINELAGEEKEPETKTEEPPIKGMKDPEPEEKQEAKESGYPWKKIIGITVATLLCAVLAAYGYGVYYYSNRFLPATVVDGVSLDNMTPAEASAKLTEEKAIEDRVLLLKTLEGQNVSMSTEAMGITRNYLGLEEALLSQDKWTFPVSAKELKDLGLQYEIRYDKAAAEECLLALEICDPEKTQPPVNSEVIRDEKGVWVVTKAVDGNTVDLPVLTKAVVNAVSERKTEVDIDLAGGYLKATVREDDPILNRLAAMENKIDQLSFTIDMGADVTVSISADEYRTLLKDGLEKEEKPEVFLDAEALDAFMDKLERKYNTKADGGYRYFHSITGQKILMKTNYGWELDKETTKNALGTMLVQAAKIACGNDKIRETYPNHTITAVWLQEAVSHEGRDTGESWVEVNLTTQKMYCIIDGEIKLESNVVSGTETEKDRKTPSGIFSIRFKAKDRDLVGYNPDGTESYRSHVLYWMPVYNNIGLHDATWRASFGGRTYLHNGSHGCVNLPVKTAEKLYGMVEKGMSVIFYRENEP